MCVKLSGWVQNCSALTPLRTAALTTKAELVSPPCHRHIDGIFHPQRGFSRGPALRVVCKAMPLLWSATCSRRLPRDLHERDVSTAVLMRPCVPTRAPPQLPVTVPGGTLPLTDTARLIVTLFVMGLIHLSWKYIRATHVVAKGWIELPAASCRGGRLELSWLERSLYVSVPHAVISNKCYL